MCEKCERVKKFIDGWRKECVEGGAQQSLAGVAVLQHFDKLYKILEEQNGSR